MIKKIDKYFISCQKILLVLIPVISSFLISSVISLIISNPIDESYTLAVSLKIVIILILTPLLETFLFQFLVFSFFFKKLGRWRTILFSALVFSMAHFNKFHLGIFYLTPIIFGGFILAYIYSVGIIRRDINPFKLVIIIHFSYNFLIYTVTIFGISFS